MTTVIVFFFFWFAVPVRLVATVYCIFNGFHVFLLFFFDGKFRPLLERVDRATHTDIFLRYDNTRASLRCVKLLYCTLQACTGAESSAILYIQNKIKGDY